MREPTEPAPALPWRLLALGSVLVAFALAASLAWSFFVVQESSLADLRGAVRIRGSGQTWSMHPDLCERDDAGALRFYDDTARGLRLAVIPTPDAGWALEASSPGSTGPSRFGPADCRQLVLGLDAGPFVVGAPYALSGHLEINCLPNGPLATGAISELAGQVEFERCR